MWRDLVTPCDNTTSGQWIVGARRLLATCAQPTIEKRRQTKSIKEEGGGLGFADSAAYTASSTTSLFGSGAKTHLGHRKCNFGRRLSSNLALRFHTKEPSNREGGGGASDGLCGSSLGTEDRRCVPDLSPSPSFFLPALNSALVPSPEY